MKDLGGSLFRYFHLRETPNFIPALEKMRRSLAQKRLPFFSEVPHAVLLYRGLEILLQQGFSSPAYQLLLKTPLYRDSIVASCSIEKRKSFDAAAEGLNIDYLGLLYDSETFFWGERSKDLRTLAKVLPSCRNLLKNYISWWLDGNDLQMADEYSVTDEEYSKFSLLLRAIYFSILMVGSCSAGKKMLHAIAQRNPAGTPPIDGDDLWLQRVAALKLYDLEGFNAFLKQLPTLRYEHFFYTDQVNGFSAEQKQALYDEVDHSTHHPILISKWLSGDL